ncbi:MAG TPA: hypothetical protein VN677_14790, partial [Gemmatimonadaceae bacterium]|nr:hypothetical protein [Gemmatimonadaceae bacterium]
FETAASLEMFLRDQYLRMPEQLLLVCRGKPAEHGDVVLDDPAPFVRTGGLTQTRAAATLQKVEHGHTDEDERTTGESHRHG